MPRKTNPILGAFALLLLGALSGATAAELKVASDGPLRPALQAIAEAFKRDAGHTIVLNTGPSPVVLKRLTDGEMNDVVIIQPEHMTTLAKDSLILGNEHPVVARVGIGLFARASDAPRSNITTLKGFEQALSSAGALVINNVASGNQFMAALDKVGLAERLKGKIVRVPVAEHLDRMAASPMTDVGVGTISLIVADKRLRLIGKLPPEVYSELAFKAARHAKSANPDVAAQFIAYLQTPAARQLFAANGVD